MKTKIPPKKTLGQNFLINKNVQNRIIDACNLKSTDTVIEIGPGKGALTEQLVKTVRNVIAIEKDGRCIKHLADTIDAPNLELIHADVLK